MHFRNLYTFLKEKVIGYKNSVIHPAIRVELSVEVSFNTFVQVCFTNETGRYRINDFTGYFWQKEILLTEHREIIFKVFVNNHLLKPDQWILLKKTINTVDVTEKKFYLNNQSLYEGWFYLT